MQQAAIICWCYCCHCSVIICHNTRDVAVISFVAFLLSAKIIFYIPQGDPVGQDKSVLAREELVPSILQAHSKMGNYK